MTPENTPSARYQKLTRIAVGGMGEVWRARDTMLGREVALKVLKPEFAGDEATCQGDSGGPALDMQGRVVGITSRGGADCSMSIRPWWRRSTVRRRITASWAFWINSRMGVSARL